jgi:hypothetical protein
MNLKSLIRFTLVALLGAAAALLVSCGSSGKGLIPSAKAGPLQEDFEAVAQAAATGNGNCAATERALGKTEQDFLGLPATVNAGLHKTLEVGIENLRKRALSMCIQPGEGSTGTTGTTTGTTTTTTQAQTTTTESTTTPATTPTTGPTTTPTTSTTTSPGASGGTEAGDEHAGEAGSEHGKHGEHGEHGAGQENGGGGSDVGGASPGVGQ